MLSPELIPLSIEHFGVMAGWNVPPIAKGIGGVF